MMNNNIHTTKEIIKYYPNGDWSRAQFEADLAGFVESRIKQVWLIFDSFYDANTAHNLQYLLDDAHQLGIDIFPTVGQFILVSAYPSAKMITQPCITPPSAEVGCLRHPKVLELAITRTKQFFADYGQHPALRRIGSFPLMTFFHESDFENENQLCYCNYCQSALLAKGHMVQFSNLTSGMSLDADTVWNDCQFEAIPQFLSQLMQATRTEYPVWVTQECAHIFPAFAHSVLSDNEPF